MQKMLEWMKMDPNEFNWVKKVGLERIFNLQWTMPKKYLLQDFLRTQE
jgi:hypothetical protein